MLAVQHLLHAPAALLVHFDSVCSACAGFHEFAEFTTQDVGTVDSGLNSMVLANNSEMVLLPVNEPTHGTKRKSQIQTYLEHNAGPGVQHLALKTDDIFTTLRKMREVTDLGGMDFMARTSAEYYKCAFASPCLCGRLRCCTLCEPR